MKKITCLLTLVFAIQFMQATPAEYQPMFGGKRTPSEKTNRKSSDRACRIAWNLLYDGQVDEAMKVFNNAWLFDSTNAQPYWGFGIIEGQKARGDNPLESLQSSLKFLQMALSKDPKNPRIQADAAFTMTLLGQWHNENGDSDTGQRYLREADSLFEKAAKRDRKYPPTKMNWAINKFHLGDVEAARKLVMEAQSLGMNAEPQFLDALKLSSP